MSKNVFKTSTGHELELRRPTYRAFKNIAAKVAALMEIEFDAAMTTDEFAQVLNACVVQQLGNPAQEGDEGILGELPYDEAARLWDAVMEYCEFESFFAARQQQHYERSKTRTEQELELQVLQMRVMKDSGLLPESYFENAARETLGGANPNPTPPSSTTTPTTTDGTGSESSARTSGGSSGTSPKRSAGGKRSAN